MPGNVQSVERAASMLQLLAEENEPLTLQQIAGALSLAKGTAHGLLRTLVDVGFIEQVHPAGPYRVSAELFRLGVDRLDLNELRARALNWTDALAARTGESTRVAAFRQGHVVVAHHVFSADETRQTLVTGTYVPLHASALGKILLAFDPGAARSIIGQELPSLTYRTVTDRFALQRELAVIRDVGWAAAVEESEPGICSIAASIRDRGGHVVAAVGIEGPVEQLCDERSRPRPGLVTQVVRAGRAISRELGHGRDE
ncbi:IclR family transcriptional regulator [Nakamurella silvestris]|nr:IclR family transcriptional regulator [Nakamurella silvestris]